MLRLDPPLRRLPRLVLLVAEILGMLYYGALRDGLEDPDLERVFASIHDDEVTHIAFHLAWLGPRVRRSWAPLRAITRVAWTALFRAACLVMSVDHAGALRCAGVEPWRFRRRAGELFVQIAVRLFGRSALTAEDHRTLEALAR